MIPSKEIEEVQLRAARYFLGVNRFCPIPCLNAEMGWYGSTDRRAQISLRYYERLVNMDSDRLPKKIFLYTRHNEASWGMRVRNKLEEFNLEHYWDSLSCVPAEFKDFQIREAVKTKLQNAIASKSKLRTYSTLRVGLEVGTQIKCLYGKKLRSLCTQLKCGTLPIRLETGRFHGEKVEERICKVCGNGNVESEIHFLLECPAYALEQKEFINRLCLGDTDLNLKSVFKHPFALGKYVNTIWEKRKTLIST